MRVTVKLYGTLRRFSPAGANNAVLQLHEGAAVAHAIAALRIPPQFAQMIISGDHQLEPTSLLHDGQQISLFPPLAGGCRVPH
jgi:molybdopterin converting factor small subunit